MKINSYENENTIMKELGERIRQYRIALNFTQAELANRCGISESTEKRIENGEDSKISNIIKIMMQLGIAENFNMLIPEQQPSYKALFEKKPNRKRATSKNNKLKSSWIWGEDKEK